MLNLETRIAALEQASPQYIAPNIFICCVAEGSADELKRITYQGQTWERHPDESEQDLKDRADRESAPNARGFKVFSGC